MILYEHKGERFGALIQTSGKQLNIVFYDTKHVALLFAVGLPLEWPHSKLMEEGYFRYAVGPFAFSSVWPQK
jgi:hypothetical protein